MTHLIVVGNTSPRMSASIKAEEEDEDAGVDAAISIFILGLLLTMAAMGAGYETASVGVLAVTILASLVALFRPPQYFR